jgi:hypothetical protein
LAFRHLRQNLGNIIPAYPLVENSLTPKNNLAQDEAPKGWTNNEIPDRKAWIKPLENLRQNAYGYDPLGYVDTKE